MEHTNYMHNYNGIGMKKAIIIAPNFLPESVGGASRIYEMAKKIQEKYNVTVVCPPPTYPFTKYKKSKHLFRKAPSLFVLTKTKMKKRKCVRKRAHFFCTNLPN